MEKTTKRWSKRTFTPEFKMEVLSYHYTHGEHRSKTCEKYGISEVSLRQWLKTYKVDKEGVSLQSELEKSFLMKQPQETDSQEAMKQRIAALEKALEYERMRCARSIRTPALRPSAVCLANVANGITRKAFSWYRRASGRN